MANLSIVSLVTRDFPGKKANLEIMFFVLPDTTGWIYNWG